MIENSRRLPAREVSRATPQSVKFSAVVRDLLVIEGSITPKPHNSDLPVSDGLL